MTNIFQMNKIESKIAEAINSNNPTEKAEAAYHYNLFCDRDKILSHFRYEFILYALESILENKNQNSTGKSTDCICQDKHRHG